MSLWFREMNVAVSEHSVTVTVVVSSGRLYLMKGCLFSL